MKLQKLQSDLFDFAAGDKPTTRPTTAFDLIRDKCKTTPIHDFAYGVMYTYRDLPKLIQKGKVHITDDGISLTASATKRDFYFFEQPTKQRLLHARDQNFRCMVPDKVDGLGGFTTRKETVYDLEKVFDPMSYPNATKRRQRIKRPFVVLDRENIRIEPLGYTEIPEAIHLHDKWVAAKFQDAKVHRISFPVARYRRCTEYAFHDPSVFKVYKARDYNSGEIIAVRVVAYEGSKAFGLAYYSDFPNMKSQLTEYLNVAFMKEMQNEGITSLNVGLASGKGLCQFKNHFPNEILTWYQWK